LRAKGENSQLNSKTGREKAAGVKQNTIEENTVERVKLINSERGLGSKKTGMYELVVQ